MVKWWLLSLLVVLCVGYEYPFQDPSLPWDERVQDLVGRLTLEEKIAQMSHGGAINNGPAPAISRLGINPWQWGTECLRGDVNAGLATAFPQALGLAASFNTSMLYAMARATSDEVRAKHNFAVSNGSYAFHTGIACWSPVINMFRDPRWGRGQETYGEDPYLTGMMVQQYVTGLQGDNPRYFQAISGCKHFDVFGGPENMGTTSANVTTYDWRTTFLPAFQYCVEAGAFNLMCSYNAINGIPSCANQELLTDILREEWGFQGYVISDQYALELIQQGHHYTTDLVHAAAAAANAGCNLEDGNSVNNTFSLLGQAIQMGLTTEAVVNQSVSLLFMARMRTGEFDPPNMNPYNLLNMSVVDSPAHRALAVDFATQSFVLLKNTGVLPLNPATYKMIAIMGPQSINNQTISGDYSPDPSFIVTPYEGLASYAKSQGIATTFTEGCDDGIACTNYNQEAVISAAKQADVVVLFMGIDTSYESEGLDRTTLNLPGNQAQLIEDAHSVGKPVVLVLLNCGPLNVTWAQANVEAILEAFYPAQAAGTALALVLFGDVNPGGRLPVTWPQSLDNIPDVANYTMVGRTYRYSEGPVIYPFGYGLSYTTFSYSNLVVYSTTIKPCQGVNISVSVTNTGKVVGSEVTQIYISWVGAPSTVPIHQLAGFTRQTINPGETITEEFTIVPKQLALWSDDENAFVIGPMQINVWAGGQQPNQAVAVPSNVLSSSFTIVGAQTNLTSCSTLW